MNLQGLQRLTLLDFPGVTACTVFTSGCNFRCPFCHNAPLVINAPTQPAIDEEEFFAFLKKRQGILEGVAVTGGEPLLQSDIAPFLRRIRDLGYRVKLDTNGSMPDRLGALLDEGLVDHVAMDIKNSPSKYGLTVGVPDFDIAPILHSIDLLMHNGVSYEFRTTLVRQFHTDKDMFDISLMLKGAQAYFLQAFRPGENVIDSNLSALTPTEMEEYRSLVLPLVPNTALRGV